MLETFTIPAMYMSTQDVLLLDKSDHSTGPWWVPLARLLTWWMGGSWNCLVKILLEHNCTSPAQWSTNAFILKEKLSYSPWTGWPGDHFQKQGILLTQALFQASFLCHPWNYLTLSWRLTSIKQRFFFSFCWWGITGHMDKGMANIRSPSWYPEWGRMRSLYLWAQGLHVSGQLHPGRAVPPPTDMGQQAGTWGAGSSLVYFNWLRLMII